MNDLESLFFANTGRLVHKWHHYFEIYDRHFSRYRGSDAHIMEIGVYQGGSLQMWRDYFGPAARIYGVDINPHCREFAGENIEIIIGDQEDRVFLESLKARVPRVDILIDDGGHTMRQQINTFEVLFPHVAADGVYLCEDMHTSYWPEFDGGYRKRGTFVEYSKDFIDALNAWHRREKADSAVSSLTRSMHSLHYYDSILAIEKRQMRPPVESKTGSASVPYWQPERRSKLERLWRTLRGKN